MIPVMKRSCYWLVPSSRIAISKINFATSSKYGWDFETGMNTEGQTVEKKDWIKVHLMCGVKTNVVTAVAVTDAHALDIPYFKPLVDATARNFTMRQVSADKAYLSAPNLQTVVDNHAMPYIALR